jgi:hypothetical protein
LEGLSLALLDAMAAGVCVLASDIPENNEVVEGAGFTFRHGDQEDLALMLDLLIQNPSLRRQAAARQRERIQVQYLWPDIARLIEAAYYNVLGWSPSEYIESAQRENRENDTLSDFALSPHAGGSRVLSTQRQPGQASH